MAHAPQAHRVWLRDVATGERIERWPVDARELIRSGAYTADDPQGDSRDRAAASVSATPDPEPSSDPVPHVTRAKASVEAQSPTGAPLVIAPADGVSLAAPVQMPSGPASSPATRATRAKR